MTELTIDQALQQGIEAHKAGQIQEADRLYTAIMKAQPKHPDANHNMGVLAVGVGKVEQALPFFKTALEANPATAQFWLSYIDALIKLGRLDDAKAVFDQAKSKGAKGDGFDKLEQRLIELNEGSASDKTLNDTSETNQSRTLDIAIQLTEAGEFNQAIDLLTGEINQFPEDADILALLSHCYLLADQVDEAKLLLDRATTISPDSALVNWNICRLKLREQKTSEAINLARDISRRFPDDIEGMGVLGACLRVNGEVAESLEVLNKAIELRPNFAEALINRGLIRLSQVNKPEALADLERAHRLKPHIRQIWDLVVGLKVEAQEYSDAIPLLINMIEIDPNWEKGFLLIAACNQKADDSALAVKSLEKILEVKPGNAEMHVNLGLALAKQGETNTAMVNFKKALTIKPDYAEPHYHIGNTYKNQKNLKEAIKAYNNAVTYKPDYVDAHFNMGNALKLQGKLEKAIKAYRAALIINPDFAAAYNNMGSCLNEQGKLEEAIEAYNKAIEIKPDNPDALNNIGNALREQGKLEEAIKAYIKALAIKPDDPLIYNNMGNALKEKGELEEALDAYNKALAENPDDANTHNNIGNALKEKGELEEAVGAYNKALALNPKLAEAINNIGLVLKQQSKFKSAMEAYEHALSIKPDYPEAYNNIGIIYHERDDLEKAIQNFKIAIDIKPNYALAHQNLSFALLNKGILNEALSEFEWRSKVAGNISSRRNFTKPLWDGTTNLNGKRIFVWSEFGVGDIINWSSRIPYVSSQADHCILECPDKLYDLFSRSLPNIEIKRYDNSTDKIQDAFDVHLPIGSLYKHTVTSRVGQESKKPFLLADPARVSYWRKRLKSLGDGPYVGISWKSGNLSPDRLQNYAPLSSWTPVLKIDNIKFINLQYVDYLDDLIWIKENIGTEVHNFEEIDHFNDLDEVAALCKALDIVVSTKITVPFISAGVGTRTLLVNWRQSSWNNVLFNPAGRNVEIFQRNSGEPWDVAFQKVAKRLAQA